MKTQSKSRGIPLDDIRLEGFKDPKRAKYAVKLALEEFEKDNDVDVLLDTLRLVAQAQGGIASLARKTSISRQALHQALSPSGNPRLRTFQSVLGSLGFQMSFKPLRSKRITRFCILDDGGGLNEFGVLARAQGIIVKKGALALNSADAGGYDALLLAVKDGGPYLSAAYILARVIIAYLRAKSERRIVITRDDGDKVFGIDVKGYSHKELASILEDCQNIFAYEPPKKTKGKSGRESVT